MQKRIIWFAILLFTICNKIAAEDGVSVNDFSISPGETKQVSVMLDNEVAYVGFQFDVYLPDGFTITSCSKSDRIPDGTSVAYQQQTDGCYRVIAPSFMGNPITGNSGAIVTLTVEADASVASGDLTGYLRNIKVSKSDGKGLTKDEESFTITVEDGELEPYAVLTDNDDEITKEDGTTVKGKTITFYYDRKKADNNGMSVGPFSYSEAQSWCNARNSITKVEFDASFANCTSITSTAYWFYDCTNLTDITGVENLKTDNVTDMNRMFYGCSGLTSLDVSNFKTDNVTDMYCMFYGCSSLVSLDVSNFSTENVTNMGNMFRGCSGLSSLDLSNFNTANVTDMGQMFSSCSGLKILDVSNFNTANVTNMNAMFYSCSGLTSLDVGNFNTANVGEMNGMFGGCSSLESLDVSNLNTTKVTNMGYMFGGCSGLESLDVSNFKTDNVLEMEYMFGGCSGLTNLDVSKLNTANVTNMGQMFSGCSGLTSLDVSNFNTANVTNMEYMFSGCSGLESLDVNNFNTENVTYMRYMFFGCSSLTSLDLSNFNTTNVTDMGDMFSGCSGLTSLDLSNFNTSKVIYDADNYQYGIQNMFSGCSALTTIYVGEGWNIDNLTESADVFKGCTALVGGAGTTYDADHTDYTYAHIDGGPLNPGYLTDKKDAYAALSDDNTVLTFYYDNQKETRGGMSVGPFSDYSEKGWHDCEGNITKVVFDDSFAQYTGLTSTFTWFDLCSNLATIEGLSNLNTENVENMRSMFESCSSLTSLDLSNFNTAKVKDFGLMFAGCSNLATIYVGEGWSTGAVTEESTYMFADCTSLVGGAGTSYDDEHKDATYARIDGGEDNPGYLTGKILEPYAVLSDNDDDAVINGITVKGKTLTFYYDKKKSDNNGMSVGPFNYYDSRPWDGEYITSVVFAPSFVNCTTITNTAYWFSGCNNLTNITGIENLNTANVTDMEEMFGGCSSLINLNLNTFNTSNVTSMHGMFNSCVRLSDLDLRGFDTGNVTDMEEMFDGCSSLINLDLRGFDTGNVTDMSSMFSGCTGLTSLDLGSFYTAKVTSMRMMFMGCKNLNELDLSRFNTANVRDMSYMFSECSSLTSLDVSKFNTANVTNMRQMFYECKALTSLDVSKFNTSKVTNMFAMFNNCNKLHSLDVSNFNTEKAEAMSFMFSRCSSLAGLDVSNFNTGNAIYMDGMFLNCSSLTSLDLSSFNTSNVTGMKEMFYGCSELTTVYVGNGWSTASVTDGENLFTGCVKLVGGDGTEYDADHVDASYAHIDGGEDNPGYLTDKYGVVITVKDCTREYGATNPNFEYTTKGASISGKPTITCSATASSSVGTYPITITYTKPDSESMLNITCINGTMTITKAPLTITAKNYTIKRGEAVPTLEATYSGFKNQETEAVLSKKPTISTLAKSDSEAGVYDITVSGAEAKNYEIKYVNGTLTITDDVKVTAKSYSRVYGEANPAFEFTSEGATLSGKPTITCSATATSPVGTYTITIAKGNITNSEVTYVNGTLTITKAPLTITAKSYTIKQGQAMPTLESECSGFKNNETDTVFTTKPIVSTNATSNSEPGTYDITVSGAEAVNYEMTYVKGTLTITKRTEFFDGTVLIVEVDGNINDAFESCGGKSEVAKTIAAIVWNDTKQLKAEMLDGISNPNLLIYVNDENLAPTGFNNIVVNGVAKNIKLTDGGTGNYNFNVPQAFTADSISYSREFKQATRDSVSRGWESIALPFTVQTFTHEEHGNISPFGNDACEYHFWLRQPTENGVVSAMTIEANKPYIISMPNSDEYEPEFNHAGWILFASANVTVPVTDMEQVMLGDSACIVPTFQEVEQSPDLYVLNVGDSIQNHLEGSVFISDYRSARPFEAYVLHKENLNSSGARVMSLSSIFRGGKGTTDMGIVNVEPATDAWFDLSGRRLQSKPSKSGLYIHNGKKVFIKNNK